MGNTKGSGAELEVRNLIRGWWILAEPNTTFSRTPLSGGWHASSIFKAAGDLMVSPGSKYPWSTEVKRREGWSPAGFIAGHRSPVWKWWAQSVKAAAAIDAEPMLWARRSHGNWIVLIPSVQATSTLGAPPPRFRWGAGTILDRGATVVPVGYWAEDILATDPSIWLAK